jgi:hypothetical protein
VHNVFGGNPIVTHVPGGHWAQEVAPASALYVPPLQRCLTPSTQNSPGTHCDAPERVALVAGVASGVE